MRWNDSKRFIFFVLVMLCTGVLIAIEVYRRGLQSPVDHGELPASEPSNNPSVVENVHGEVDESVARAVSKPATSLANTSSACIRGRVLALRNLDLDNVRITVTRFVPNPPCGQPSESELLAEVQCDHNGEFSVFGLPLGVFAIVADAGRDLGARAETRLSIDRPCADVTLIPSELMSLEGYVVDVYGNPIPNASISVVAHDGLLVTGGPYLTCLSDAAGEFRIYPLTGGEWKLDACAVGFGRTTTTWQAAPKDNIEIVMAMSRSLEGAVLSAETGIPLPGLQIEARTVANDRQVWVARSGDGGEFTIEGLGEENVFLSIDDSDYILAEPYGRIKTRAELGPVTLRATKGAVVSGVVYDGEGNPLDGVSVVCSSVVDVPRESVVTSSDGKYAITGIPAGRVVLYAKYAGQPLPLTETDEMRLEWGSDVKDINFTIGGASVFGMVSFLDGSPAFGAVVSLQSVEDDLSKRSYNRCTTGIGGGFAFVGLNPGLTYCITGATSSAVSSEVSPIVFEDSLVSEQDLVLSVLRDGELSGVLVDDSFRPVFGTLNLDFSTPETPAPVVSIESDYDGRFFTSVPDRARVSFQVTLASGPGRTANRSVTPMPSFIDFRANSFNPPLILKVKRDPIGEFISGRVIDSWGDPVVSATVQRLPAASDGPLGASISDIDGRFRIEGLAETSYTLLASHPEYASERVENIPSGSEDIQIEMFPVPVIAGIVLDAVSGDPVEAFDLQLTEAVVSTSAGPVQKRPNESRWSPFVSPEGKFSLECRQVGEVNLYCRAEGYSIFTIFLDLGKEDTLTDLVLEAQPVGEPIE